MDDKAVPGRQIPDRDESIATLFYACYPKLVRIGYSLAGDWAATEEVAQQAFVRGRHRCITGFRAEQPVGPDPVSDMNLRHAIAALNLTSGATCRRLGDPVRLVVFLDR